MAPLVRPLVVFSAVTLATAAAASTDGSTVSGTVKPQCAVLSLKAPDAPVRASLAAVVGPKLVDTVFNFITDTPFGKVVAGADAQTCIANFNGTMLGQTIVDRLQTPTCAAFVNVTDIPFVKYAVDSLTANATTMPSVSDMLTYFKAVPNAQVDQFCTMYTTGLVPCIVTELLPALAVIRSKYANGCCDDWSDHVLNDSGYSISGHITKLAQLFGDVMCAQQTPGIGAAETQRCGYTALQTLVQKNDTASFAATLLRNLQVPSNQMCLRAEGKPYTDTNNQSVGATEPSPSGCVVTLDRITSWIYGLPWTQRSQAFDTKSLFEDDKCLRGSELYPTFAKLLPSLASSELEVYFRKSCVHLPMGFGDKCTYARPALLVEWPNEPQPVANKKNSDGGPVTATTRAPVQPSVTPLATKSSATGTFGGASLVALMVTLVASVAAL